MTSLTSSSLSRTSSVSSVGSDDSMVGSDATSVHSADATSDGAVKRTRKRFSSVQLIMLEHLYRKASHPTREEREQVAKDAEIDIRSVTVWFQNKRQTDRRIHRQLSEPAVQLSHPPSSPMPLPPSSPFSDASGNTIHTVRVYERTRTLSGNSSLSATTTASRKRDRDREYDAFRALARHVRRKPSRTISLDDIALRAERPVLLPRTPPQLQCIPSSSSPARPQTPEPDPKHKEDANDRQRALWENMPSSPAAPEPVARPPLNLVRYGYQSRRLTLEYACAREMMGDNERERKGHADKSRKDRKHRREHVHRKEKHRASDACGQSAPREAREEEDLDIPVADWDMHGDTDTEDVLSEAPVTPSSSFGLGELSMQDPAKAELHAPIEMHKKEAVTMEAGFGRPAHDEDMMDAAYVLFHLSQRR